jgi:hypothetical protein
MSNTATNRLAQATSPAHSAGRSITRCCRPVARHSSRSRWTTGVRRQTGSCAQRRPADRQPPNGARPGGAVVARARLADAARPVLVAGPDVDASGGWDHAIALVEAPSCTLALRNRLRISRPGSYYLSGSGGLGVRDFGRGRGAAGPTRAPSRVRDRRGLGTVRDHGAVERDGLQNTGYIPWCCATTNT